MLLSKNSVPFEGLHYTKPPCELINVAFKETRSVTINIFRKKYFLFKSFLKIELSYVFTINIFSTAEGCMEQ